MQPFAFVLSGSGSAFSRSYLSVHCLLLETEDGYALVDTGFGTQDFTQPTPFVRAFALLGGAKRDLSQTALRQVIRLGIDVDDIHHIVLTHLHPDHAGGLPDFPNASVHVYTREYEAAMHPRSFTGRFYEPAHWAHGPSWVLHASPELPWYGFASIPILPGVSPEIRLIPLPGHTPGHCGVAVRTSRSWLLHCGDAYIYHGEVESGQNRGSRPRWMEPIARRLFPHAPRLRLLRQEHGHEVQLFCAHDPAEVKRCQRNTQSE